VHSFAFGIRLGVVGGRLEVCDPKSLVEALYDFTPEFATQSIKIADGTDTLEMTSSKSVVATSSAVL